MPSSASSRREDPALQLLLLLGQHGELPLHKACGQAQPRLRVVRCLLDAFPDAVRHHESVSVALLC